MTTGSAFDEAAAAGGVVLVCGENGVIGRHVAAEYARLPGWTVRGLGRRDPGDVPWQHVTGDLSDAHSATRSIGDAAADTTHLVFAAYAEQSGTAAQVAPNVAMLRHAFHGLVAAGAPVRHVTLYQGGKAYGAHLGAFKTPAKESDPRLMPPNFYYDQEDLLRDTADERGWAYTVLRPEAVIGHAVGNPMNLLSVIAVYAAVSRELGLPLRFPGSLAAYDALYQMTDAQLLARATVWAGGSADAAGEVFNVTNGDQIRWRHVWPLVAAHSGMDVAEPQDISLVEHMADKGPLWQVVEQKYRLRHVPWEQLVGWQFGDFLFHSGFDNVSSTVKIRRAGFGECHDSEDRLLELLDGLASDRIVPPLV